MRVCCVFLKTFAEGFEQSWVFISFQDDLAQELFRQHLLLIRRKREYFRQSFNNHSAV